MKCSWQSNLVFIQLIQKDPQPKERLTWLQEVVTFVGMPFLSSKTDPGGKYVG